MACCNSNSCSCFTPQTGAPVTPCGTEGPESPCHLHSTLSPLSDTLVAFLFDHYSTLLESKQLAEFKSANPQVKVVATKKHEVHPYVRAEYRTWPRLPLFAS